ncbi:MAG: hypothetical protein ABH842_02075 [Candidatus Micrarchaeota archaeon]
MEIKYLFVVILLFGTVLAVSSSSNIKGAIENLEETTRSTMLFGSVLLFGLGLLLLAIAAVVHFFVKTAQTIIKIGIILCGLVGLLAFLGGLIGFGLYFLAPSIIDGLVGV